MTQLGDGDGEGDACFSEVFCSAEAGSVLEAGGLVSAFFSSESPFFSSPPSPLIASATAAVAAKPTPAPTPPAAPDATAIPSSRPTLGGSGPCMITGGAGAAGTEAAGAAEAGAEGAND